MSSPAPGFAPRPLFSALLLATLVGLAAAGVAVWRLGNQVKALTDRTTTTEGILHEVLGEVTRTRLEQSAGSLGPQALLTKLRTYAPLLVSARTAEPDFKAADKEMKAILRAFAAVGQDAWAPIVARLGELSGDKNFDEVKWLLEAAVVVDPKAGKEILKEVLLGRRLPAPRLRWYAARMMTDLDRPLAQNLLRQIVTTESSHGVNVDRAAPYGGDAIDPAAAATTGFHNFIKWYVGTDDPKMDETLLMVIGRAEHDQVTIQECIKVLGERRCAAAIEPIQKLYKQPPLHQENPLFLMHCVDALHAIGGESARPFLEEALRTTTIETVANHIKGLLKK